MLRLASPVGTLAGLLFFVGLVHAEPTVSYHVSWDAPQSHYLQVRMTISALEEATVDVRIPAWRPGRYIMQNYAKDIIGFGAADADGRALAFTKTDKGTWRVTTGGAETVVVRYRSYARQLDAGASYLDETEASLNPITFLMYIPGRERAPVSFTIDTPPGWKVATALSYDEGRETYVSASYHDLVDNPILASPDFVVYPFDVDGARFELVFQGEADYDPERVVADVRAIVETEAAIMGGFPFERYVFLYHLMPTPMGHGVEHKNSTSIVIGPANFKGGWFYEAFLNVTAHEFFHAWNVERIRPEPLYYPDYAVENYTTTLWIYEGITSYYAGLALTRAGLTEPDAYLQALALTLQGYDDTYARTVTSPAMTSWDSWTKSNDAAPDTYYSFYTAGNVLGLLLDLEVRGLTENEHSLDDVFRYLFDTYARNDRGVPEDGFERALEAITGTSFQAFFDAYVYGTETIDYNRYLRHAGLTLHEVEDPNRSAVRMGVGFEHQDDGLRVRSVRPASAAYQAGLDVDDLLHSLDGQSLEDHALSDLLADHRPGDTVTLTLTRRGRTLTVPLTLGGGGNLRYDIQRVASPTPLQSAIYADWLASSF